MTKLNLKQRQPPTKEELIVAQAIIMLDSKDAIEAILGSMSKKDAQKHIRNVIKTFDGDANTLQKVSLHASKVLKQLSEKKTK